MVIDEAILKRAIKIFWYKRQINKAHEECLELALAITHYLKKPSDKSLEDEIDAYEQWQRAAEMELSVSELEEFEDNLIKMK